MILPEFCVDKADGKARPYALIKLSPKTTADDLHSILVKIAGVEVHTIEGQNMLEVVGKSTADADSFFKEVLALVDQYNTKQSGNCAELLETRFIYAGPNSAKKELQLTASIALLFCNNGTAADQDTRCRIFLEPGYAFGTGHHPSTRLAASALEEIFNAAVRCPQRVLDVGCGSGILSLLCAKSGAAEVLGIDINPDAVETARRNVVRNNLAHCVRITDTALREISEQFDLLVANVTPSVMGLLAEHFPGLLKPGGQLVIAGFQMRQADDLVNMLQQLGFTLLDTYEEGSWRAMSLKRTQ
jgi:FkbM family methyltransferase